MKKKFHSSPSNKYNKLFKFLTFDQSLFSSIFITFAIFIYAFAVLGVFFFLDVQIGQIDKVIN